VSIGSAQDTAAGQPTPQQPTTLQPAPQAPREPPATGDGPVDEALARLAAAMSEQLEDQVTAYDAIHRTLTDRLTDVEG
jgi:hypothetical protein